MNIQRLPSSGARASAVGQLQRSTRTLDFAVAEQPEVRVRAPTTAAPATPRDLSQRLACYANNIDTRLSIAIALENSTPSQKAALEAVQERFPSMIQRLDDALLVGGRPKSDITVGQGLERVLEHLASSVSGTLSDGKRDVSG